MRILESDSLRRIQLRAVGGQSDIRFGDNEPVLGLFVADPQSFQFEDIPIRTQDPVIFMLTSDARRSAIVGEMPVEVPGQDAEFQVARSDDESGMTVVQLREI